MKINSFNNSLNFNAMKERELTIQQEHGIHLLPAGCFSKLSYTTPYDVYISKDDIDTNVRGAMMKLLCLEVKKGEKIKIKVDENYPALLLDTLVDCLSSPSSEQSLRIMNDYLKTQK